MRHWLDIGTLQAVTLPYDRPYNTAVGKWWVLYDGEIPAAFAGISPSARWQDTMYLCRSGVLSEYRGRGMQKRLIRVRLNYARKLGMRWVISDVRDNFPSCNSLISCGFRLYEPSQPWAFKGSMYFRVRVNPSLP